MEPSRQFVALPEDAAAECLAVFGLPVEIFLNAITAGWLERQTKTPHHAKNFAGVSFQGETLGHLRQLAAPHGWTRRDIGSFAAVLSPTGDKQIVVRSACDRTGTSPFKPFPRCKNRNGRMLIDVVAENVRNRPGPDLFSPDVLPIRQPTASHKSVDTYLLLIHVDISDTATRGHVRSELSLPTYRGPDSRISGFHYRILLPTIVPNRGGTRPEQAADAEVKIVRRAS